MEKFPFREIFFSGFYLPLDNAGVLLKLAWPYLVLGIATELFAPVYIERTLAAGQEPGLWIQFVPELITLIFGVMAAVACHRVFILGLSESENLSALRWGDLEWAYFYKSLVLWGSIVLFFFIPVNVLALIDQKIINIGIDLEQDSFLLQTFFTLIFIPFAWFWASWTLVLPASALGEKNTLAWAWKISKPYRKELFFLLALFPIGFYWLIGVYYSLVLEYEAVRPEGIYFVDVFVHLLYVAVAIVELCFLSLSYQWIIENTEDLENTEDT